MKLPRILAAVAALALVGGGSIAMASSASAHTGTLNPAVSCSTSGVATVTWSLNNDYGTTMTVTASNNDAIPTGSTVAKQSTRTFTQTVGAPAAGAVASATLTVKWPDGYTQNVPTKSVTVPDTCVVPLIPVNLVPVTQTPPTCDVGSTYTIPALPEGLKYTLNPDGSRPVAGTYPLPAGASVSIQEHSIFGYVPVSQTYTFTGADATGHQSTDPSALCYTAPPKTPVTGNPVITVTGPTCDAPYNTISYDIPEGLSINGFTGKGTIKAEDYPAALVYGQSFTADVVVADGFSYDGPATVTYGPAIDPATVDCTPVVVVPVKPEPIVTDTDTRGVPDCDTQDVTITHTHTVTDWVLVDNVWVKGEPVVTTTTDTTKASAEECPLPPVIPPVTPPTHPVPPVTPPVKPVPPVTIHTPAPPVAVVAHHQATAKATPTAVAAAPSGLAFTGSTGTHEIFTVGGMIVGLGIFLLLFGRHAAHMNRRREEGENQ